MHFSTIASVSFFLAAASAQSYLVERDPSFKSTMQSAWNSFKGGAQEDVNAYKSGFSTGYAKRDLELREAGMKDWINSVFKADARAMGTIDGAAAKAFLGSRDVEDLYADGLYAREADWRSTANQGFTAIEKSLGTVAGKLGRTFIGDAFAARMAKRDAEEDIMSDELYIRSLFEDDMFEDSEGWY